MIIQAFLMKQESVIFTAMLPDCLFIATNGQNRVIHHVHSRSHGHGKTAISFPNLFFVWMTSTLRNLNFITLFTCEASMLPLLPLKGSGGRTDLANGDAKE